jgi:hypothetical protein
VGKRKRRRTSVHHFGTEIPVSAVEFLGVHAEDTGSERQWELVNSQLEYFNKSAMREDLRK